MAVGCCASDAVAAGPGGVSATEPSTGAKPKTASKVHLFPVTSRSRSVAYKGPVYEKTATGEVVPFVPSAAGAPTGTAASATGGARRSGAGHDGHAREPEQRAKA